jgi:hypothetical protein
MSEMLAFMQLQIYYLGKYIFIHKEFYQALLQNTNKVSFKKILLKESSESH